MKNLASISFVLLAVCGAHDSVTAGTVFAVDADTQNIVELDAATGTVVNVLPTPDLASGGPDGLAASGSSLFFVNGIGSNLIHEIDARTGASVDAFPAPLLGGGTDGLAYMDDVLYTLDGAADTVFRVDRVSRAVLGSCTTGTFAVGGLAAEDGRLFAISGLTAVVEIDPATCAVVGGPFPAPAGDFFLGLAFDGTHLYASTWVGRAVLTLDPATGVVLDSFQPGFAASGLASSAAVPGSSLTVDVDVKPNLCVNHLNVMSRAAVRVVLLGSDDLDVGLVDASSLRLEGVAPMSIRFRDLSTPEHCSSARADGHLDVVMTYDAAELTAALLDRGEALHAGLSVTLELEGALLDGTPLTGTDVVVIRRNPINGGNPAVPGKSFQGRTLGKR